MSRKRGKNPKAAIEAVPDDILAEGSGSIGRADVGAVTTVEDVVTTTDDIATTEDVVTPDDVVATARDPEPPDDAAAGELGDREHSAHGAGPEPAGFDVEPASSELSTEDPGEPGEGDAGEGIEGADGEPGAEDEEPGVVFPTSAATMDAVQLKHLVEALIFASDRPLTVQRLRQLTRVGEVRRLEQALTEIAEDYRERGLVLQQVSGGYQFRTRTQFSAWVQQLIAGRPVRLSRAQLEALAIIAYRQPITRPEIDDIRGVDSTATLKLLIDRMLIRALGKREEVGRPTLYGTTKEFLDFFSLGDLRELPTLREYSELTAESRKVMSDRLGIPPDGEPGGDDDGSGGEGSGGDDGGGGGDGGGPAGGGDPGPSGGGLPDDGAPASASTAEMADALASFLSAADAVDRSDAAEIAEAEDAESVSADDLDSSSSPDSAVGVDEAMAADRAAHADRSASNDRPFGGDDSSGGDSSSDDGLSAREDASEGEAGTDGQVGEVADWPAGSDGVAVIALTDDRPVERAVMKSDEIEAIPPFASSSDAPATPAHPGEPATE